MADEYLLFLGAIQRYSGLMLIDEELSLLHRGEG